MARGGTDQGVAIDRDLFEGSHAMSGSAVGFVGLGDMGGSMAACLAGDGFALTVRADKVKLEVSESVSIGGENQIITAGVK